jgi:branched-chain amino acid transport system substrate-binding protein
MTFITIGRRCVLAAVAVAAIAPAAFAQDSVLRLGSIFAQTGPNASIGTEALTGVQYAARRINEAGGVEIGGTTYTVEIENIDDESRVERSVAAAERLVSDPDIPVIFTPPSSTTTLGVVPIAQENGRISMSFIASAPAVTGEEYPLSFRSTLTAIMNIAPAVEYLVNEQGATSIAYIGRNDDWGRAAANAIQTTADRLGVEVVMTEYFESGSTDFYGVITAARASGADAVIGAAFVEDGVSMITQYRELQMDLPFMSVAVIWASPTFMNAAGDAIDGIYISTGPTTSTSDALDAFSAQYMEDTGLQALPYVITGYDNVNLVIAAMQAAGSIEPAAVAEAMKGLEYQGLLQSYNFGGDTQSDVVINIVRVDDGAISVISSARTE